MSAQPSPSPKSAPLAFPDMTGRTILQVIPELGAGGAERTVLEMAEAITAAGGRALAVSYGGRLVGDFEALGGRHITFNVKTKNPIAMRANASRLAKLITEEGVDLIHARSRAPAWSAYWAAQRTGIPFVTTYHGAYSARSKVKRAYNAIMAKGDRVIANSEWTAGQVRAEYDIEDDRLVTIPRGVDLMLFDPAAVAPERVEGQRRAWELEPSGEGLCLLLPGRLTGWKGQGLALEALSQLSPGERERLTLVLLGDAQGRSDYVQGLMDNARALEINHKVRFMPHTRDMPAAFLASDIVISASTRPEAFGRTTAEASAMGRPVIAPDHGGARETVIEGETGTRFTPGDAAGLAASLRTLISIGPSARAAMGEAGRRHITANFSKRGLQAATLQVYSDLLGGVAK
ncbi:MAG: glycosyltransferase family 4 protein, partial [Pseudomonadota bacterium]